MMPLRALLVATVIAVPLSSAAPAAASPGPPEAPRVIRVVDSLMASGHYWSLRAAVRDWNRAEHVRFVLVTDPPTDALTHTHLTEFTEMVPGTVERAIDLSGVDYTQEISLNWTSAEGRGGAYRKSIACAGLGMLVTGLPSFHALAAVSDVPLNRWASCMDPEAQWAYPLPAGMSRPGRLVLEAAR